MIGVALHEYNRTKTDDAEKCRTDIEGSDRACGIRQVRYGMVGAVYRCRLRVWTDISDGDGDADLFEFRFG